MGDSRAGAWPPSHGSLSLHQAGQTTELPTAPLMMMSVSWYLHVQGAHQQLFVQPGEDQEVHGKFLNCVCQ